MKIKFAKFIKSKFWARLLLVILALLALPAQVFAADYNPSQIKFQTDTPQGSNFRAVVGEKVNIVLRVSFTSGSAKIVFGDTINRFGLNPTVDGFYAAMVPVGTTDICSTLSCSFTAESIPSPDVPFTATIVYDANQVSTKNSFWAFPVLFVNSVSLSSADEPFTTNPATINIETFPNESALIHSFCAANPTQCTNGQPNPGVNPRAEGRPSSAVTSSSEGGSSIGALLLTIVNIVLGIIIAILRWLLSWIANGIVMPLLEATLKLTAGDIASGPILTGWTLVRDVVNMFFILFLIVIGLGTILKIESYNYKKLLVNLIIFAMLVNFSMLIGRIIIELGDTVQFNFLSATEGPTGIRALYNRIYTGNDISSGVISTLTVNTNLALMSTMTILFRFVLELGVVVTFAALAVFMLIRTVALWILLVLSPVAYAFAILPATAGIAKQWWDNFIKYVMFAPLIAFFIRLSFLMYDKGLLTGKFDTSVYGKGMDMGAYLNQLASGKASLSQALELMMVYIMILAFLWAGMIVSKNMGIAGAGAITSLAQKAMAAPFAAGWAGTKALGGLIGRSYSGWVGRKIGAAAGRGEEAAKEARRAEQKAQAAKTPEEKAKYEADAKAARARQRASALTSGGWRALSFLNPKVVAEAWKKRREEKELRAYGPAVGHMQDTFNRIVPTEWLRPQRLKKGELGKKTYHGLVGERGVVSKEAEDLLKGVRTREDAARTLRDSFKSGDKDEIMAALKVVQHGNWQDDYMNLEGKKFTPLAYLDHITEKMKQAGFSKEDMMVILDDLKETGEQNGRIRAYGYTTEDPDGSLRAANDLSYYQSLDKDGLAKVFKTLEEKFKLAFEETGSEEFKLQSDGFAKAVERAENGESFDSIVGTKYISDDGLKEGGTYEGRDDVTLKDAMVARRFMDEAHIKFQRGNAGQHARNIEAAIMVDQDPEKGWTNQNILGKLLMHELGPNIIESITARIHESQGRLVYGFGAFRDKQTGKWSLPDQKVIVESRQAATTETDPEKRQILEERAKMHELGWKKITETQRLSPKFFRAITQSDRLFTEDQRKEFKTQFNQYVSAHPNEHLEEIKEEKKEKKGGKEKEGEELTPEDLLDHSF